jgi:predicted DNA-binding antitoxin AbrB/MazE fold protein
MELSGVVSDGVVKLDEPCSLPEGTKVKVIVETQPQGGGSSVGKRLLKHAGTVADLPKDLAEQHDHYIHGTPKR